MKSLIKKAKIFILVLAAFVFSIGAPAAKAADHKEFVIVASTFPVYLFSANICAGAENVKLELLIPAAAGCPHDFMLRPGDMQKLATANVLVINGAHLEDFLDKAIANSSLPVINASHAIPLIEDGDAEHHAENPHTFAAPKQAALMAANIANGLSLRNPENSAIYKRNAEKFVPELEKLSDNFAAIGANAKNRGIAIEHDALAYLVQNAGLELIEVFENSASASRLAQLKKFLLEKKPALLAGDSQYPDRLLKTLAAETDIPFARLDPCASGPVDAPLDYYQTVMEKNLKTLEAYFAK